MAWRDGQDGQSDLGDVRVRASARPMGYYMEARVTPATGTVHSGGGVARDSEASGPKGWMSIWNL
jgi:hypothetical protein